MLRSHRYAGIVKSKKTIKKTNTKQLSIMSEQEKEMERLGYRKHKTDDKGNTSYHINGLTLQSTGVTVSADGKTVKPYSR